MILGSATETIPIAKHIYWSNWNRTTATTGRLIPARREDVNWAVITPGGLSPSLVFRGFTNTLLNIPLLPRHSNGTRLQVSECSHRQPDSKRQDEGLSHQRCLHPSPAQPQRCSQLEGAADKHVFARWGLHGRDAAPCSAPQSGR